VEEVLVEFHRFGFATGGKQRLLGEPLVPLDAVDHLGALHTADRAYPGRSFQDSALSRALSVAISG